MAHRGAEIDVEDARHMVVVDGRIGQGCDRAAAGRALDPVVVVLAFRDPAFRDMELPVVGIIALGGIHLQMRDVAVIGAGRVHHDTAGHAGIGDELGDIGGQAPEGEAAGNGHHVPVLEAELIGRFDIETVRHGRSDVEELGVHLQPLAGKVKGVVPGAVMIAEQYWVRPAKQLLMLVPVETVVI